MEPQAAKAPPETNLEATRFGMASEPGVLKGVTGGDQVIHPRVKKISEARDVLFVVSFYVLGGQDWMSHQMYFCHQVLTQFGCEGDQFTAITRLLS